MKDFIKSLEGKGHFELARLKSVLVQDKLAAHRAGDNVQASQAARKIELVRVTMAALAESVSQG